MPWEIQNLINIVFLGVYKFCVMRGLFSLLLFLISFSAYSQREVLDDNENWWGILTSGQIAPNYALWMDSHFVNETFWIIRSGLTYQTDNGQWALTAGYAYLRLGAPFSEGKLVRPEHRPWGQVVYRVPGKGPFTASFRFRYDARFRANLGPTGVEDGYMFNSRFRFNNSLRYNFRDALSPHFNFATSLLNESLITTGPAPVTNAFEHRIFFLLNFQKNSITLSPGYQVRFLDFQPDFLRFRHGFIFWLTYNYRFKDFKRKNFDVLPTDKM
ncbi:DUF2490 domain-containing protein [Mariniradius sediminis]|uniref:DUF2490 domain-containing protein n=1 Tax=Mariniradius sediminis TaxID=2909237 RepID=A0ABS9BXV7_9BACT|nr:DUF2490 domain-containing protein [Mariniradius sediminis]MCF1752897.1 DUF2490 domain-containing protein [Mariniradius sediminis]